MRRRVSDTGGNADEDILREVATGRRAYISQLSGHTWIPPKSISLMLVWFVKSCPVWVAHFDCGICKAAGGIMRHFPRV